MVRRLPVGGDGLGFLFVVGVQAEQQRQPLIRDVRPSTCAASVSADGQTP
ncbi:hypothetical protein AB0J40_06885 [Amycolatopsis sp. NPDC049691]